MAHEPNSAGLVSSGLLRFSIRQLLIWTAVIALGCVALRSASPNWVAAMFGLTLLMLAAATLLIVFRQGADRAHWIGFATFGWLYMLLLLFGWSTDPNAWDNPFRQSNLATYKISAWAYDRLYAQSQVQYTAGSMGGIGPGAPMGMGMTGGMGMPSGMGSGMMPGGSGSIAGMPGMGGGGPVPVFTGPSQNDFVNVAHALWVLLLAAFGGWLARWLYATGPAAKRQAADNTAR